MAKIVKAELLMVDLKPKVKRTDAIQSFDSQQTPIVRLTDAEGCTGIGYTYTIGQGGESIVSLLKETLLPHLLGADADGIEKLWRDLLFATHATSVGAITSLSLAAVDTALWDLKCCRAELPLYKMSGSKVKIGKKHLSEDRDRLRAVREAVGDEYEIMVDANQGFSLSEAIRRAKMLEEINIGWFEEPLPADDVSAHAQLAAHSHIPIAVGESMYSISQFKDYLHADAASIIQVDVARVGGITPWLKVAHMAEAYNVSVCPHFLMELHVSLVCAVTNTPWLAVQ